MNRAMSLDAVAERISGPFKGYYLAAYALPADDGFVGYVKISARRVRDIWTCSALVKVGSSAAGSPSDAIDRAEIVARQAISSWIQQGFF